MKHYLPYKFFVNKPKTGWRNLALVSVCSLIPYVGQMVIFGYRREMALALEADPELKDYPDFDFNRFMDYLVKGIWPLIDQIIMTFVFAIPYYVAVGVTTALLTWQGVSFLVAYLASFLLWTIPLMFMYMILWPMEIHSMKRQKFNPWADFQFALKFLRKVGIETFVAVLVSNFVMVLLMIVGMMLFCVGWIFTVNIYQMAAQHLQTQLYLRYLDEGGEPLDEEVKLVSAEPDDVPNPEL